MRNTRKTRQNSKPVPKQKSKQDILNEYIPGTCYGCQICLHCHNNNCDCDKTIKPKSYNSKSKKRVAFSREISPDSLDDICKNYLDEKNQCFNYNIDFSSTFSVYFCIKCHSKFCRTISKKPIQTSTTSLQSSSKESSPSQSSSKELSPKRAKRASLSPLKESSPSPPPSSSDNEDNKDPLDLKFKLSIKKVDNSTLPQKWLNVKLTSHFDFTYDIEKQLKKSLKLSTLNKNDYTLTYQALHTRGVGTQLFDNDDWKEFLNDIKQMTKNNKTLLVNVSMIEKKRNEEKRRYLYNLYLFYKIYYIIIYIIICSDEKFDSEEDKRPTSKKSKISKECELSESERRRAQIITKIREKYHCSQHQVPCLITEMGHDQLTIAQLIMWSNDIVSIFNNVTFNLNLIALHLFQLNYSHDICRSPVILRSRLRLHHHCFRLNLKKITRNLHL